MLAELFPVLANTVTSVSSFIASTDPPLPLKFAFHHKISPHAALMAQAFCYLAIHDTGSWEQHANTLCYHYGIGRDYLESCLSKARVFNPNYVCVDCGVLYEILDPTKGVEPMYGENDLIIPPKMPVRQWRCKVCENFRVCGAVTIDEAIFNW